MGVGVFGLRSMDAVCIEIVEMNETKHCSRKKDGEGEQEGPGIFRIEGVHSIRAYKDNLLSSTVHTTILRSNETIRKQSLATII